MDERTRRTRNLRSGPYEVRRTSVPDDPISREPLRPPILKDTDTNVCYNASSLRRMIDTGRVADPVNNRPYEAAEIRLIHDTTGGAPPAPAQVVMRIDLRGVPNARVAEQLVGVIGNALMNVGVGNLNVN